MADINKYLDISRAELIKQGNRLMDIYYKSLEKAQNETLDEIKKVYGEYLSNIEPANYNAEMNKNNRLNKLLYKVDNILNNIDTKPIENQSKLGTNMYYFYLYTVGAKFVDIPEPIYNTITGRTLDGIVSVNGKRFKISDYLKDFVRDPKVRQDLIDKYIAKGGDSTVDLIKKINKGTRENIRKKIKDAIARGDNYKQIAKVVYEEMGIYAKSLAKKLDIPIADAKKKIARRSEIIARNELMRSLHASEYAAYKKAQEQGINPDRYLIAVNDNRTRQQSMRVDGLFADKKDDLFHYNGYTAPMPKQWGVAKYDINDREQVGYRFKGDEAVKINQGRAVSSFKKNFYEWAKANKLKRNKWGELIR